MLCLAPTVYYVVESLRVKKLHEHGSVTSFWVKRPEGKHMEMCSAVHVMEQKACNELEQSCVNDQL